MADNIYFDKNKNTGERRSEDISFSDKKFTEKINPEQLNTSPGNLSFSDIVTEDRVIKGEAPVQRKKKNNRKKSRNKTILISSVAVFLAVILLFLTAAGTSVSYILADYTEKDFSENIYAEESSLMYSDSVYNILLMGIDTSDTSAASRSDAMILMSIDKKNNTLKLSSFLRDSYVAIPGYGNAKLNAACVYGGPQLVCDTIESNFGIRIDDYAKVGYDMFIKVIDAVGGVTIPDIDETEVKALAEAGFITEAGENIKVNGVQALAYCRIRKGQSDFNRTSRQREVISLVLKKLPRSNPFTLLKTAKEIASTIECSISKDEFFTLLMKVLPCLTGDIEQMHIPADGTWYNDTKNYQAVLVVDFAENKALLDEFIYG